MKKKNFVLILGVVVMLILSQCRTKLTTVNGLDIREINTNAEYKKGSFVENAGGKFEFFQYCKMLKEFIKKKNTTKPKNKIPNQKIHYPYMNNSDKDKLNVTWLGHSTLLININGYKILTDPVFEKKVSIVGPTRFEGTSVLNIDKLPDIDVVIISHNHYDHLNKYSIQKLKNKSKKFIVPLLVGNQLVEWGISKNKIIELDWWKNYKFDSKLEIICTPAKHFSGRSLMDRNKTLWASFVIKTDRNKIYFSGDSAYFNGFKKIGEKYGPFDITFIECGAYNELWDDVHMFPEQTVQAHIDLKGKILQPIHWSTFDLALHDWDEPMRRLTDASERRQIVISTPKIGETILLGKQVSREKWWELKN